MNVPRYMQKYAKIAGMDKEAIRRRLGKRVSLGKIPKKLGRNKAGAAPEDPGYVFLNSGAFQKIFLPPVPPNIPKKHKEEKVEDILDMFGRIIGNKGMFV